MVTDVWTSECGQYRVAHYPPTRWFIGRYYSLVYASGAKPSWVFTERQGPYRTQQAAMKAALRHKRAWTKFVRLSHKKGKRIGRLAKLNQRYRQVLKRLPIWAMKEADPSLLKLQFPGPGRHAPTETSRTFSIGQGESPTATTGRASNAAATEASSTKTTTKGRARRAKAPAKAPKEPAKPSTKPRSTSGKQPSKRGAPKKPSGKAASKSSPKKKGKR